MSEQPEEFIADESPDSGASVPTYETLTDADLESRVEKIKYDSAREDFAHRLEELKQATAKRVETYGEQDVTATILSGLLDICNRLNVVIHILDAGGDNQTVLDLIYAIKEVMDMIDEEMFCSTSYYVRMGFWARRRAMRKHRKSIARKMQYLRDCITTAEKQIKK